MPTDAAPPNRLSGMRLHRAGRETVDVVADEIALCLRRGDFGAVKGFFVVQEAIDIAGLLEHMDSADALAALDQLPVRDRAEVFGELRASVQQSLGSAMPTEALAAMMAEMSHDERADLFNRLDAETRDHVLPSLARAERDDLRKLAAHDEGSAGAIMTSDYATLRPDMSAPEALEALRAQAIDSETVYTAFVVDADHRLLGRVSLREILLARAGDRIGDIMQHDPVSARLTADPEECAALIARYDLIALPILDADHRLVGIVTHDDALDVATRAATEDIHKSSTIEPLVVSFRDAAIGTLYRARILWLVLLVFASIVTGAGIAHFEEIIAGNLALLFFLPLLIGSGGNAGAQSATLMIRALATGEVHARDWGRMLAREVTVAGLLGLTMAGAVAAIGLVQGGPGVALAVSLSMILIVMVGALVGMSLPLLLIRIGFDPATASGPLVTSIADVLGVVIYFSIAGVILGSG